MRQPAGVSGLTHLCQPLEAARLREHGIGVAYGGSGGIMSPMPVENTLMSTRPMEKTLGAPERLDLESRTAFRRAAGEVLDLLAEGAGRLVIDLSGTRSVDSAGLGALMLIQRKAAERRQTVCLRGKYSMAYAPSGAEAMRQLTNFEPDVLVLDMRLPDTDGIELLQRIRETRPTLPVVVTTAYVSMEPLMNVLDLGHSRYLVKPYELSELAAAIDAAG